MAFEPPRPDFEALFHAAPGAFLVLSPDFTIVEANKGYLASVGGERTRLVGRNLFDLMPRDPGPYAVEAFGRLRESLERVLATGKLDHLPAHRYESRKPDGSGAASGYISVINAPVKDAEGKVAWIVHRVHDVTERRVAFERLDKADAAQREAEEKLEYALQVGRIGAWSRSAQTEELTTSSTCRELFGRDPDAPFPYRAFWECLHPDDHALVREGVRRAFEKHENYDAEYRVIWPSGEVRWLMTRSRPRFTADGAPLEISGVIVDITDRKRSEEALRAVNEKYRLAVEAGRMGAWGYQRDSGLLQWDEHGRKLLQLPGDDPITYAQFLEQVRTEDRTRLDALIRAAMEGESGGAFVGEYRTAPHPGKPERWLEARGQANFENGAMTEFVGVTSDITDRKRSEAHLKLMINELNHRVKNSLATVQSIAVQTFREHQDGRAARDAFVGRLMALSRVHDVLTRESWEGAGLREVAEDATRAFQSGDARRIALDGPDVRLSPKVALSLSLALNELATNAAKYGALSNTAGRVVLEWRENVHYTDGCLTLTWCEIGGPPVAKPERRGFGSRLIERVLAGDLGGKVSLDFHAAGLVCTVSAGLSAWTGSGEPSLLQSPEGLNERDFASSERIDAPNAWFPS